MSVKPAKTEGMPLVGKEYWEQQAKQKEAEGPTPWKSPEGTNYVPIVETKTLDKSSYQRPMNDMMIVEDTKPKVIKHLKDHPELINAVNAYKEKNGESVKIEKPMMDLKEIAKPNVNEANLNRFADSLSEEDRAAFDQADDKKEFMIQYMHEFKPSHGIEVQEQKPDTTTTVAPDIEVEEPQETAEQKKPYVAPEISEDE